MEKRGFLLLAIFIVMAGFFAANHNAVTGQAVIDLPANKFSKHIEVAEGQTFLVPGSAPRGYNVVTFSAYDPINNILTMTTHRGTKQFVTGTTTPSFFSSPPVTADLVYNGKTIKVLVNDKIHYPDNKKYRMYLMTYTNPKDIVNIGETLAFSKTDFCALAAGCEFFHPEVWSLDNIDPNDQSITFNGVLSFTGTREFIYEQPSSIADLIVYGQAYQVKVIQPTPGVYALQLLDPKFNIMDTTNVGIAYYK